MTKNIIGTWLVSDSYTDPDTHFLITEMNRVYGTLNDAYENTVLHRRTQDLRIQFYSHDDQTSN